MNIITLDELSGAIIQRLELDRNKAKQYAMILADRFGFEDRIIDNALDQKDRQLFYYLETKGILYTKRETVLLPDGRQWRIHYWILAKQNIVQHTKSSTLKKVLQSPISNSQDSVYSNLPKEIWTSRKQSTI